MTEATRVGIDSARGIETAKGANLTTPCPDADRIRYWVILALSQKYPSKISWSRKGEKREREPFP